MALGPNIKKLIIHRMSLEAIPAGSGLEAGVKFLSDPKKIMAATTVSIRWVEHAIKMVRLAMEPNPWKEASDEAIAGELLRLIEERKKK